MIHKYIKSPNIESHTKIHINNMSDTWFFGLVTIAIAIFIYQITKVITRPSLPLPPGPRPWPILGNFPHMGAMPHHALAALAQKHGPLLHLRLGFVDVIVAASSAVAEQCLKTHDANFVSRPMSLVTKHVGYGDHGIVFGSYGPRWRMFRKLTAVHMFSGKALDGFKHIRKEEVARLMSNLASSGTKAVNLGQLVNVCITNAVSRMVIGSRVFDDGHNGGHDPNADEFKSMVVEAMVLSGNFNIADYIPALEWLDLQGFKPRMKNLFKKSDQFFTRIIEENNTSIKSENHRDFLSLLLSLKDDPSETNGVEVDDSDVKALISNMFLAGTDTSSNTIEWVMAELIKNPRVMTKMQQELDTIVGRDKLVTEEDLINLPYLEAIVKETFRLHPPAPLSLPRVASESCEILGYHIPKKSTLLVNIWAIGRDPKEWLNPLEFKPERFLPGGEKANVDVKGSDFEIIPFGAGRRICAGMTLGIRFVSHLTATLVHAFDWELESGLNPEKLNMDEIFGLTLPRKEPLVVHPRPRLPSHVY